MKVSVAMAVYNGAAFLEEQIDSILPQLRLEDELIVSLDNSNDRSEEIIKEYVAKDRRVKLEINQLKSGVVKNFENALMCCSGDIIFYSDQDDVWSPDKIEVVLQKFANPDVSVVIHDAELVDKNLKNIFPSTFLLRGGNTNVFRNLVRLSYIGCCMAFRANLIKVVVPIPTIHRSHDWWTGSVCSLFGSMELIDRPLIKHRMHEMNATPKQKPSLKYHLEIRFIIIYNLLKRIIQFKLLSKI